MEMKKNQKTNDRERSTKAYELTGGFIRLFYRKFRVRKKTLREDSSRAYCLLLCLYTQEKYIYNQKKGEQP